MSPLFGKGSSADRDREQRQRSADEREQARRDREARRAAREGRAPVEPPPLPADLAPPPVEPPPVEPPVVEPEPAQAPAPEPVAPPEPEPVEPEPFWEHEPEAAEPPYAAAPEPIEEPTAPHVPSPSPDAEAADDEEPPALRSPARPVFVPAEPRPAAQSPRSRRAARRTRKDEAAGVDPELADLEARESTAGDEPVGIKRVAASAMASSAGASPPPRFGAPPRGTPRRRRGRRALPIAFLIVVALVGFFLYRLYEPGADGGNGKVVVTIPAGDSAAQIGKLLAKDDVVSSSFFFSLRARLDGGNLRSGRVELKRGMSYAAALTELTKPAPPIPVVTTITLPEGPSSKELAGRVKAAGFKGSYVAAARRTKGLDPTDYGAPKKATLEGFLFPATYELKPGSTAKALVAQQVKAFKREFALVDMTKARKRKLSKYDVVIIASMIEREAQLDKERRLISGVIYNRLEQNIPLGIDATIRYELDNFSRPLKVSELQKDTPYNTRTRQGLPPGPIGNPGLASLKAAANPASNSFIYYVVKPCGNGAHAFSSTDAKFQQDVAAYNKKRDQLGGKDPAQCP